MKWVIVSSHFLATFRSHYFNIFRLNIIVCSWTWFLQSIILNHMLTSFSKTHHGYIFWAKTSILYEILVLVILNRNIFVKQCFAFWNMKPFIFSFKTELWINFKCIFCFWIIFINWWTISTNKISVAFVKVWLFNFSTEWKLRTIFVFSLNLRLAYSAWKCIWTRTNFTQVVIFI